MLSGLPFSVFPTGWFQIGWSDDFVAGEPRPLRCFGRDLVAYRGASGDVHVLDAHCPHMGAHLGYGGVVDGDDIDCPFHGWRWSPDGVNVSIPGTDRPNRAQRLMCWTVVEQSDVVLLWHSPAGGLPSHAAPELVDPTVAYHEVRPSASREWLLAIQPHVVAENAVDSAHFSYVHRASEAPEILRTSADGAGFRVTQEITYGGGKPKTWLTPDGPTKGALEILLSGVGLAITRFVGSDEAVSMVATTPIDQTQSVFRMTNWVPRDGEAGAELSERAQRRVDEQFKQAERDFVIWENMAYVEHPPLTRAEARPYRAFREWARSQYEEGAE